MLELVDRFLPVLDRIENDLGAPLEIGELSKQAFYSKYHFQRVFRDLCGRTVGEYLRARRMTEASEILLHTDFPMERIAFMLGYRSARTFRNAFEFHYGVSPAAYRRQGTAHWHRYYAALSGGELRHLHSGNVTLEPEIEDLPARRFAGLHRLLPMDSPESDLLFDRARLAVPERAPDPHCFVWNSPEERLLRMHHFAVVYDRDAVGELPPGWEELSIAPMRVARFRHRGAMAVYEWSKRYIWQEWNRRGEWTIDENLPAELAFRFEGPNISREGFEVVLPLRRREAAEAVAAPAEP